VHRLETIDYQQLLWKQTGFGARNFELRSGDDLVGVLYWPKLLSDRAVAECASGKWYADQVGLFRHRTVMTDLDSGLEVASFEPGWMGDGDLVLANGHVFQWYKTKALCNSWALVDPGDNLVLEVHEGMRWFKHEADVVLHVHPGSSPELSFLILVSWYLGYTQIQDEAAAVAAACVV
jgi:hypothetical protein